MKTLIKNAQIVNEGKIFKADVLIENDLIAKISSTISEENIDKIIDAEEKFLIPGVIDDHLYRDWETDRKSTRLNSSHITRSRMPSSA